MQGVRRLRKSLRFSHLETKLRKDRDFEEFEGKTRDEVTSQKLSSKEVDAKFFD
jgi:hypothetical protein